MSPESSITQLASAFPVISSKFAIFPQSSQTLSRCSFCQRFTCHHTSTSAARTQKPFDTQVDIMGGTSPSSARWAEEPPPIGSYLGLGVPCVCRRHTIKPYKQGSYYNSTVIASDSCGCTHIGYGDQFSTGKQIIYIAISPLQIFNFQRRL